MTEIIQPVTTTPVRKTKQYKCTVSQAGTAAPTANVLRNTIGTLTWSRQSTGIYLLTSNALFRTGYTIVFATFNDSDPTNELRIIQLPQDDIQVRTYDGGVLTDGMLSDTSFMVEVWEE